MRIIDADLAMRKIREYMEDYPNATTRLAACRACLSILGDKQQVPTIDPESLRPHGRWNVSDGIIENVVCSRCGTHFQIYYQDYRYCPRCGAKMDGGEQP